MRINSLMLTGAYFIVLSVQHAQEACLRSSFETRYGELQSLVFAYTTRGTSDEINGRLRRVRNEFISGGDLSADFLISKLNDLDSDEIRSLEDRQDFDAGLDYRIRKLEEGKTLNIKNEICWMLADMFPKLSSDRQSKVLTAIVASFTPSTYSRGEMSPLLYSLLRIGPRSVPSLLVLAKHKSEAVRCESAEILNDMGREWKKSLPSGETLGPPEIGCRLPEDQRLYQIEGWSKCWEAKGNSLSFPKVPSFFDLPTTKPH